VLNALPHADGVTSTFRNANGVAMKLANFLALDPTYPGAGLTSGGRRDAEVWDAWNNRRDECRSLAASIRAGVASMTLPPALEGDEGRPEGGIVWTTHKRCERDGTVTRKRKQQFRAINGQLECEACAMTEHDARLRYGAALGDIFECHHRVPLGSVLGARKTGRKT